VFVFRNIALLQKKIIVIFQDNIISRRITTKTSVNGIFYMVVERVEHYFDVCSGQLIVTCVVGKTEIPIHQESFNRCTSKWYMHSHDYGVERHFQQYVSYFVAVNFICGGNRSTRRKPPTCPKSQTNFIT
jgi:hypothetical protein